MPEQVLRFLERHGSFILTTHDNADADGLGAEQVFACILNRMGKEIHIINAGPVPECFLFMDPDKKIEEWDPSRHNDLPERSALLILDTADEYNIGRMRDIIGCVRETLALDHHEKNELSSIPAFVDSTASSACELAVEAAQAAGVTLDKNTAIAAYAGIAYDTGSFSYIKTTARTFRVCFDLIAAGAVPYSIHKNLNESGSMSALLLQKKVLSSLEIHCGDRVAVQILRQKDIKSTGAAFEDAESFVNFPLKAKDIAVSIMIKETADGRVRCSLRSKGTVNVSKIARIFSGGGHTTSAGFRSELRIEKALEQILGKTKEFLDLAEKGLDG
jgi:phosphoesterase RecJ-like protein